jgi:hypothetical protein
MFYNKIAPTLIIIVVFTMSGLIEQFFGENPAKPAKAEQPVSELTGEIVAIPEAMLNDSASETDTPALNDSESGPIYLCESLPEETVQHNLNIRPRTPLLR